MKNSYEIPVVFRVMPEEETQQAVDQVVAWLENSTEGIEDAGSVTRIDRTRLGRRRLAYEIDGQRDAFYVLFYATVDTQHLTEFELNMRLYDAVLRYAIFVDEVSDYFVDDDEDETTSVAEDVEDDEESLDDDDADADEEDDLDDDADTDEEEGVDEDDE